MSGVVSSSKLIMTFNVVMPILNFEANFIKRRLLENVFFLSILFSSESTPYNRMIWMKFFND